jgi:UDP-N-acetylmuramoyl-tripeptide--D-alanyl-D-alanine ligase
MQMTAGEAAQICGGRVLVGDPAAEITSVTSDSREIKPGALFIPLIGEKTDAHRFIGKAFAAGASASLTQEQVEPDGSGVLIAVDDTLAALQKLAAAWRARYTGPVVGITGSVGKTTTKEMTAMAISAGRNVMKTEGNRNSQIGLPLTIFRLSPEYGAAVIEMGMSEFGEMSRLAAVASPDYAIVTNIGLSHIGNLGSQQNIRSEKLHITDRFHEGSVLFLNGDDPLLAELRGTLPFRTLFYGTQPWCDFRAEDIRLGAESSEFRYAAPGGETGELRLPVPGMHCVLDALAGLAVAQQLNVPLSDAAASLACYRSPAMRMQIRRTGGITVIDDSYNSSPDAAKSSVSVLCGFHGGRRIAVLADMLELGSFSRQGHFDVGAYAAEAGIDLLITVGTEARAIGEGALSVRPELEYYACSTNAEAVETLGRILRAGDSVLVKGSRGMKTDEIVKSLLART